VENQEVLPSHSENAGNSPRSAGISSCNGVMVVILLPGMSGVSAIVKEISRHARTLDVVE
jgi:hypothetical protein